MNQDTDEATSMTAAADELGVPTRAVMALALAIAAVVLREAFVRFVTYLTVGGNLGNESVIGGLAGVACVLLALVFSHRALIEGDPARGVAVVAYALGFAMVIAYAIFGLMALVSTSGPNGISVISGT